MNISLHLHRWGPWHVTSLVTTVRRDCTRCGGFQYRGLWLMTEKQWLKVEPAS